MYNRQSVGFGILLIYLSTPISFKRCDSGKRQVWDLKLGFLLWTLCTFCCFIVCLFFTWRHLTSLPMCIFQCQKFELKWKYKFTCRWVVLCLCDHRGEPCCLTCFDFGCTGAFLLFFLLIPLFSLKLNAGFFFFLETQVITCCPLKSSYSTLQCLSD